MKCDVAIVGGGPSGATVGTLLKKYRPDLDVVILERECFPRDHVGESHLPAISQILLEMGVWDKVEAANFPVKVGATYRWGNTTNLWDFEFLPTESYVDPPRPAKFEGQRSLTAFQVDRSIYDKILLDHAAEMGCRVYQGSKVTKIEAEDDYVEGLQIAPGGASTFTDSRLEADYYVDASGQVGILRRALGLEVESPTKLRNIAIWDYWQDAEWAVTLGASGTRIQIMSLGWGWLWFIPIAPTRTSVGLVVPAEYYKATGLSTEEIYSQAIQAEPLISQLLSKATRENKLNADKDWSFVSKRLCGENWFLAGDSGGFADPILSAGMTLAHTGSKKVAYTILELYRRKLDRKWLLNEYNASQYEQTRHHIKFADYWYSANGCFTDLKDHCTQIAEDAGLSLNPDDAFRWLATGGFALETPGQPRVATFPISGLKIVTQYVTGINTTWLLGSVNKLTLNLKGAKFDSLAGYNNGTIERIPCYRREGRILPLARIYKAVFDALKIHSDAEAVLAQSLKNVQGTQLMMDAKIVPSWIAETLEAWLAEGWVEGTVVEGRPFLNIATPQESSTTHPNRDNRIKV